MQKIFFFFSFGLIQILSDAQVKVQVIDSASRLPLSFATAESMQSKWGSFTDSAGRITIPSQLTNQQVTFSFIGYTSRSVMANQIASTVYLVKANRILADVSVRSCIASTLYTLEVRNRKKDFSISVYYPPNSGGVMCATYLANTASKKGILETISFGAISFNNKGNPKAPIRIRFYEMDTLTNLPGDEIGTEVIEIKPEKFGWLTFDLSKYKITIPPNGVVVAFEMFDAGPQYHFWVTFKQADKTKKEVEYYGWHVLGIEGKNIVGFRKIPGSTWNKLYHPERFGLAPQVGLTMKLCEKL